MLDTRQPDAVWQLFARIPATNGVVVVGSAPESWQAFRVHEFVSDTPFIDVDLVGSSAARLIVYGQTNRSFQVESASRLEAPPAGWSPTGLRTGAMTNTFRIFPTFPATEPNRFYRVKQE